MFVYYIHLSGTDKGLGGFIRRGLPWVSGESEFGREASRWVPAFAGTTEHFHVVPAQAGTQWLNDSSRSRLHPLPRQPGQCHIFQADTNGLVDDDVVVAAPGLRAAQHDIGQFDQL